MGTAALAAATPASNLVSIGSPPATEARNGGISRGRAPPCPSGRPDIRTAGPTRHHSDQVELSCEDCSSCDEDPRVAEKPDSIQDQDRPVQDAPAAEDKAA